MTRDVELHKETWMKTCQALSNISETSHHTPYDQYYSSDSVHQSNFAKDIADLVEQSEAIQRLIKEKDTDHAVRYSYQDDRGEARRLQEQLSRLERYASRVERYISERIDRPFYEAMDRIADRLSTVSIGQYRTSNTIGFKRTETITDEYGNSTHRVVTPSTITIEELYSVDNPYKQALQLSYEQFKNSPRYQKYQLSESEYVLATHYTRGFQYDSLTSQQQLTELWRDVSLSVGVIILTVWCPPAGAVAGGTLSGAELYSAASGKDWGTGRKLENMERGIRATFAVVDIIPGVSYLQQLAKTGKLGGATAVATMVRQSVAEGFEQGAKNKQAIVTFVKNTNTYGQDLLKNFPAYKQYVTRSLKNTVDETVFSMSSTVQHQLEQVKSFSLNTPMVRVVQDASNGHYSVMMNGSAKSLGDTWVGTHLDYASSQLEHVKTHHVEQLKARNAFYALKEEWMEVMKTSEIVQHAHIHTIDDLLQQRAIITQVDDGTIALTTNMRKGNYGEMSTDEIYRQLGYERISLDITTDIDEVTHLGIDGIYYRPDGDPPYIIAEAKYGSARLNYLKSNGKRIGKQMDEKWIKKRIKDAVAEKYEEAFLDEFNNETVRTQLVRVKSNGTIVINNLDKAANTLKP